MKIVVLDRSSVGEDVSVEAIKQFGEVDFYNSTPDELVAERIADANIVVANKSPMNESTMKDAKQVKMICQLSTGYDNVDIEYCKTEASMWQTRGIIRRLQLRSIQLPWRSLCWKTCRIMITT